MHGHGAVKSQSGLRSNAIPMLGHQEGAQGKVNVRVHSLFCDLSSLSTAENSSIILRASLF